MGRTLLGAVAGLISAVVTIMLIEFAGRQVFPPPPGLDPASTADMARIVATLPIGALLFIAGAWVVGAFEGGLVAAIVAAVGSALDYAHGKGLLHRDVKPANILLSEPEDAVQRRILLTDFGIARALDDVSDLTPTNTTLGTVAYSAPEQLMGQEVDGRTDQYALAATAYHLLTGTTMFPASNAAVIIGHHLSAEPPALSATRPELASLDPVLRAALATKPEDRFGCCTDFARAFAEQAHGTSPEPAAPTAPAPVPAPPSGPKRPNPKGIRQAQKPAFGPPAAPPVTTNHRWKAIAAIGGLAVIGVVGVVFFMRSGSPGDTASPTPSPTVIETTTTPSATSLTPPPTATSISPSPTPPVTATPRDVDRLLLSDAQLSRLVGLRVSEDPSARGGIGSMALDSSTYGPSDHSGQVTPRSCVGVVFTGEYEVYSGADIEQIKTQTFGSLYGGTDGPPYLLQQTGAVFPSPAEAAAFLQRSQNQWEACAANDVDATLGYENSASYVLGTVERSGDLMTVSMATNGGLNGPRACQQAMGLRSNVIVETRTCNVPDIQNAYDPARGWQRNPNWASPIAEEVAAAMLKNIGP